MRKFCLLWGVFIALGFAGCETDSVFSENKNPAIVPESHFVSEEQALEHLTRALAVVDAPGTRTSGKQRTVRSVTRVSSESSAFGTTRSGETEEAPLAYIVEFEKGQGSAILSADNRLDPVVAIYDTYVITEEDLRLKIEPEAWRTPENLYCEEDDDYYLGANNIDFGNRDILFRETQFIGSYLDTPIGGQVIRDEAGEWELSEGNVLPLLTTQWHQDAPFNNKTPGSYPAGCVAIALAQIMAYHGYPQDYCDWDLAKQYDTDEYKNGKITIENEDGTETDIIFDRTPIDNELADLSLKIGRGCKIKYDFFGKGESFATPKKAKQFLRDIGYCGTKRHVGYDEGKIIDMLNKKCPVFIGALTPECFGHAWVIDGYADYKKTIKRYSGSNLIETKVQHARLLHCNWGWGGSRDGYFASKAFDVNKPVTEDDGFVLPATRGENSKNYTWWFRIITYNKP